MLGAIAFVVVAVVVFSAGFVFGLSIESDETEV